ncbi:MAG: long-chain-fatty-acid--CoA ligase [Bryobacteraceae bacterium]|nr:long-chain-fatty-acid--CoA ligase [Bryobacteraceae bacterium]
MFVPLTPIRFLHRAVDLFGDKIGVISGSHQFRYAEFGQRVERLASALQKLGVEPGDRVAYLSFNNHQLLEGYYGVVQAGAIVMPLNVRLAPQELVGILNHSGAKVLMFENDFAPLVEKLKPACPCILKYVTLDDASPLADLPYEELLSQGSPERADIMRVDENAVAELFYTSGSTGTPKGVALTHRTLYLHALNVGLCLQDPGAMIDLHTIPLFHANGWGRPQLDVLMGVKQIMVRRFEPAGVLSLIQEHRATDMCLVPTMANALINFPSIHAYDISSLRNVMIGGAASSPELIRRVEQALKCRCFAGYGLTETAPVLTTALPKPGVAVTNEADEYRRKAMAGWSVPGVELRVVDLEMRDVPKDGEAIGEIVARGDHVMEGYYKEPDATKNVMYGGWFHTGDMAVWDREGYIHIVDRKKEIIISGGENISSLEVEKAIFAHPDVFECAVVAAPDDQWGEVPVAIVVRKPDTTLTEEQLCEFLKDRLGRFKMPRKIEFSDEPLPKTGTGKIRKLILREKFWEGKTKRVQG